ncbi:adenyl-nucleotide exchange factor sse1 [Entomortierella beljakovae]|nr:adenyl-nucleotide exchange factor sse1 [Entomortierella beljakovae]
MPIESDHKISFIVSYTNLSVNGEPTCIKVKARVNIHGILTVESAYVVEGVMRKELIDDVNIEENPGAPLTRKVKLVKKGDLTVVSATPSLDRSILNELKEKEMEMISSDKLVVDTETAKNALEEYIYDTRSKVSSGVYKDYIDPKDKDKFIQDLNDAESWLYDEGDEATKSIYITKLEGLQVVGGPVIQRYREADTRPTAARELREAINHLMSQATSSEEKYAHIPQEEKNSIVEKCSKAQTWIENKEERQLMQRKYEVPTPKPKPVVADAPMPTPSSKPDTQTTPEIEDDTKDMDID